jgi:dTMP kinase
VRGAFISFEGVDGSGKSTQMRILAERLRALGFVVLENREPGGTPIGQQIRQILLDPANHDLAPMTELLLMFASRAQAATRWITPALDRGEIVLSDRFTDSSLAYQGAGRHLGFDLVLSLHRLVLGPLTPDLTICIDLDLPTSLERAGRRNLEFADTMEKQSRLDRQSVEFHRSVRDAYHQIAAAEPDRFRLVDGSGSPETVSERVWDVVQGFWSKRSP